MLQSGTRMLVYANPDTPASIVDQCRMTTNCQTNFTTEIEQLLITADYSQSAAPMSVATAVPTSNMQNTGTANCQSLLSMDGDCCRLRNIFRCDAASSPLWRLQSYKRRRDLWIRNLWEAYEFRQCELQVSGA